MQALLMVLILGTMIGCHVSRVQGGRQGEAKSQEMDAQARKGLREFCARIAGAAAFRVQVRHEVRGRAPPAGEVSAFEDHFSLAVRRPNRVRIVHHRGQLGGATLICDAKQVFAQMTYAHGRADRKFTLEAAPAQLEDVLARERVGRVGFLLKGTIVPLDALLSRNPYEVLSRDCKGARYLGTAAFEGKECRRIELVMPDMALELWISDGHKALLHRVILGSEPTSASPDDVLAVVEYRQWEIDADLPDELFQITLPVNATRVEIGKRAAETP